MRNRLALGLAAVFALAGASHGELIVRGGSARYTADIADALLKEARAHGVDPRVVEITGRFGADQARVQRVAGEERTFFALGPHATALAGVVMESRGDARLVSLAVPNPERVQATAAYVAFYPRAEPALRWLSGRFEARTFALVYTPSQNAAVAATFEAAAAALGLKLRPVPAASSGDLVRRLRGAIRESDVVLFPVDPLLFDRESVRIVVDEARAAEKPVLGFVPDVAQLGFAGALVNAPEALAKTAWSLSRAPAAAVSQVHEVHGPMLFITKDGTTTSRESADRAGDFAEMNLRLSWRTRLLYPLRLDLDVRNLFDVEGGLAASPVYTPPTAPIEGRRFLLSADVRF